MAIIFAVVQFGLVISPSRLYLTTFFLYFATLALYYFLDHTKQHRPDNFVQAYLLTLVLKLLVFGAYVFGIVLMDEKAAMVNAGFFMATYVIFTALEVGFLFHKVNR